MIAIRVEYCNPDQGDFKTILSFGIYYFGVTGYDCALERGVSYLGTDSVLTYRFTS